MERLVPVEHLRVGDCVPHRWGHVLYITEIVRDNEMYFVTMSVNPPGRDALHPETIAFQRGEFINIWEEE